MKLDELTNAEMVPGGVKDRLAKKKAAAGFNNSNMTQTAEPTAPAAPTGAPAGTVVSQANGQFYTKSAEGTWAQSDEKGNLTGRPAEGPDSSMAKELEKQSAQAGVQQPQPTAPVQPTTAPVQPTTAPVQPTAAPQQATPAPVQPTAAPQQATPQANAPANPTTDQKPVGGVVPQPPSTAGITRNVAPQAQVDPKTGVVAAPEPEGVWDKVKRGAQAVGDYVTGATGGSLASKTRQDPNANTGKKIGATVGAGIGRAMAGGARAIGNMRKGGKPQAQQAQAAQPNALKPVPGPTTAQLKSLQKQTMGGDLNAGKALIQKLSQLKTGGYDADNFIQTAAPAMKKGGLAQSDPEAYAHFTKLARSMRSEAYEHICKILEHAGISWADLGYEVLLSESVTSHVQLIAISDIDLYRLKKLSGI